MASTIYVEKWRRNNQRVIQGVFNRIFSEGIKNFLQLSIMDALEETEQHPVPTKTEKYGANTARQHRIPIDTGQYINSFRLNKDRPRNLGQNIRPNVNYGDTLRSINNALAYLEQDVSKFNIRNYVISNVAPYAGYVEYGSDTIHGHFILTNMVTRSRATFRAAWRAV